MARAFWRGVISFSLVAIPVKMYRATESKALSFHYLHKKCFTRPKQVSYCQQDDEYFGTSDTVRGYEYAKDQYVILEESDLEKVAVKTTHAISIMGFVKSQEIDPIYYDASHYLEPEQLGAKPFSLLREVLLKTQRVALAKVAFQRREHLCSLRPLDDILVLHSLHFADEILSRDELAVPKQELTSPELEMATSLVNAMAISFKPEDYKDEYALALERLVAAKVKGEEIKVPKAPKVEIGDLMAALRASIKATKKTPAA